MSSNHNGGALGSTLEDVIRAKGEANSVWCEASSDSYSGGGEGGAVSVHGGALGTLEHFTLGGRGQAISSAKRDLIKKLSDGISSALKVAKPKAGASSDERVAHLVRIIPNPRRGKRIVKDKAKQARLLKDVAGVINRNYGNIIDLSLSPDGILEQVYDIVQSLSHGLNQEYIEVAANVERSLQNLRGLKSMLERSYERLNESIVRSDDEGLKLTAEGVHTFYKLLIKEIDRQLAILSNLTSTHLKETTRDLAKLLEDNRDYKGLISSIKKTMGTSEWGDKLGFWLSGINNVTQMTNIVNKSLKTIGMKASEYKKASKLSDLIMKSHSLMHKLSSSKGSSKEQLRKFVQAVERLKRYHGFHSEISKKLKSGGSVGGSAGDSVGGECGYSHSESKGAFEGGYVRLKKKLKKQRITRTVLLRDFKSKSRVLMDRVYNAIFKLSRAIGSGKIPLSDNLHRFKVILEDLTVVFTDNVEYALTGYYTHATAVEVKQRLLGIMRAMIDALEPLKSQSPEFGNVSSAISEFIKLVDFFDDKFKIHTGRVASDRKTGRGEEVEGGDCSSGCGGGDYSGGGEFKAAVTLKNSKNTFSHFYNIAKFKKNLSTVSSEMKSYNKNYSQIVGSAVGKEINIIKAELNECGKTLDKKEEGHGLSVKVASNLPETTLSDSKGYSKEYIMELKDAFVAAKIKLYKVAQAVDIYLQKFTDSVAASPDDVKEVAKLLSSVEIMANWFNEKSGDSIAALYELFPSDVDGFISYYNDSLKNATSNGRETTLSGHYYETVKKTVDVGDSKARPGNNFLVISPKKGLEVRKFAKYTLSKIYSLKNIISAFSYIGDKFGDTSIRAETFMSPSEIYKCLLEYLYTSVLTMGWAGKSDTGMYTGGAGNRLARQFARTTKKKAKAARDARAALSDSDTESKGSTGSPPRTSSIFRDAKAEASDLAHRNTYLSDSKNASRGYGPRRLYSGPFESGDGYSAKYASTDAEVPENKHITSTLIRYGVSMAGVEGSDGVSISGWKSVFVKTDKVFVNIIKAMAAKIFTVTGLYNMLNFANSRNYSMNPTRLILGGGNKVGGDNYTYDTPKVYPGALELYARLPLLAEFYRDVFCFEHPCDDHPNDGGAEALLISMVPEVGSAWASFINCIFDQPLNTNGVYTENVLKKIIHDINEIYLAYKSKGSKDLVIDVVSDFIAEINSRYGLMNRGEMKEYVDEENKRRQSSHGYRNEPLEEFDILDDDMVGTGVAPSDGFANVSTYTNNRDYLLDSNAYEALRIFRRRIDNRIREVSHDNGELRKNIPDFGVLISSTKESLKTLTGSHDQFKAVSRMMTGMDTHTDTNQEAYVMFHESVIAPLNILSSIQSILGGYVKTAFHFDVYSLWEALHKSHNPLSKGSMSRTHSALRADNKAEWETILKALKLDPDLGKFLGGKLWLIDSMVFKEGHVEDQSGIRNADLKHVYKKLNIAYTGLDIPLDDVEAAAEAKNYARSGDPNDVGINRIAASVLIDWNLVFLNLTNAVYALISSTGGLCEATFNNKKMIVNNTKLQSLCEETLATVRRNLDKFRGVIPSSIIKKYEEHSVAGSVNYLHEKLLDNIFNNRDGKGIRTAHGIVTRAFQLFSNINPANEAQCATHAGLSDLAESADFDKYGGYKAVYDKKKSTSAHSVEKAFSEMSHYNTMSMMKQYKSSGTEKPYFGHPSSLSHVSTENDTLAHLMMDQRQNNASSGTGRYYTEPMFMGRYDFYLQNNMGSSRTGGFRGDIVGLSENAAEYPKKDKGEGIMMKFNEVMAAYVSVFWDTSSNKIYAPLIDGVSNGPLNQAVFKSKGWPDVVPPLVHNSKTRSVVSSYFEDIKEPFIGIDENDLKKVNGILSRIREDVDDVSKCPISGVPMNKDNSGENLNTPIGLYSWICNNFSRYKELTDAPTGYETSEGANDVIAITNASITIKAGIKHAVDGKKFNDFCKSAEIKAIYGEIDEEDIGVYTSGKLLILTYVYINVVKNAMLHKLRETGMNSLAAIMAYVDSFLSVELRRKIEKHVKNGITAARGEGNHRGIVGACSKFVHKIVEKLCRDVFAEVPGEGYVADLVLMMSILSSSNNSGLAAAVNSLGITSESENMLTGIAGTGLLLHDLNQVNKTLADLDDAEDIWHAVDDLEKGIYNSSSEGYYSIEDRECCAKLNLELQQNIQLSHRLIGLSISVAGDEKKGSRNSTGICGYGNNIVKGTPTSISEESILSRAIKKKSADYVIQAAVVNYFREKTIASMPLDDGSTPYIYDVDQKVSFDSFGDPVEILFASLGKIMRTALTETYRNNIKLNVVNSIGELPLRMKESMKCNLPIFKELFSHILKKANFLKDLLKIGTNVGRHTGSPMEGARHAYLGVHGRVDGAGPETSDVISKKYTGILDKIAIACSSMVTTSVNIINELNDAPHMMETSENSISNYKNVNNTLPYMPLSHVTHVLASGSIASANDNRHTELGYPVYGPGHEVFSFNYGTRLILQRSEIKPVLEHMPGMVDILEKYNMTSSGGKKMESKMFEMYMGKVTDLARYVFSARRYATLFGADRLFVDTDLTSDIKYSGDEADQSYLNRSAVIKHGTHQMNNKLATVIGLTTNTSAVSSISSVVKHIMQRSGVDSLPVNRKYSMIYNILDLNISPINIHAMRRELPLANLYNYAYTFDSFVSDALNSGIDLAKDLHENSSTHDLLTVLCKHPYTNISKKLYYNKLNKVVKGTSSVDMYGRPKFISDQLWNKSLFGEIIEEGVPGFSAVRHKDKRYRDVPLYRNAHDLVEGVRSEHGGMTYISSDSKHPIKLVDIESRTKSYLREHGRSRFDTKLCRNLFFLANVQRLLTYKIDTELSRVNFPVATDAGITNRKNTDYNDLESYDDINID